MSSHTFLLFCYITFSMYHLRMEHFMMFIYSNKRSCCMKLFFSPLNTYCPFTFTLIIMRHGWLWELCPLYESGLERRRSGRGHRTVYWFCPPVRMSLSHAAITDLSKLNTPCSYCTLPYFLEIKRLSENVSSLKSFCR